MRILATFLAIMMALTACTTTTEPTLGSDGEPLPRLYRIKDRDVARIQVRMLESINTLRSVAGVPAVEMDANLIAAAATHARDMSIQNRPWHFGSDGSSPLERVARSGFSGTLVGETISETYETELQTLAAWMEEDGSAGVITAPEATDMGFSWLQEDNGKIWWVLVMGSASETILAEAQ